MGLPQWALRAFLVAVSLGVWFWSQALIGQRAFPEGRIGDRLLDLTAPLNRFLLLHSRWADRLLIASSALIDMLGLFLIGLAVFGPSIRPFLGMLILFVLRQVCQGLCALPSPEGMIWRDPGFPSLLVTYGVATDLFFSGHTAIAVYGCLELGRLGGTPAIVLGTLIALFEVGAVLVLRAHYTMDVFTGAVTALWIYGVAATLAPGVDALLFAALH
jgi:hypothetical protein